MNDEPKLESWQKSIIDERLKRIAEGKEQFQDFDEAIDEIEKKL